MAEYDEQIVFEMGYNKGFKDGIKGSIPRERIEQMIKEISICKTENEMRIAERDYKNKLLISGIFSEVMAIIHKYTKEQTE